MALNSKDKVAVRGTKTKIPDQSLKDLFLELFSTGTVDDVCAVNVKTGLKLALGQLVERCESLVMLIGGSNRVGISLDVSFETIIAVTSCIVSGKCFVPLDPSLPSKRLAFIAEHSGLDTIITNSDEQLFQNKKYKWIDISSRGDGKVTLDKIDEVVKLPVNGNNLTEVEGERKKMKTDKTEDIFAIYYTSGSSGEPKGVLMSMSSVLNRLHWSWRRFPFQEGEVATMRTSLGFVDSICELLSPLLKGITIAIVPKCILLDPLLFIDCIEKFKISRILLIPSLLKLLIDGFKSIKRKKTSPIKYIITSGEELTSSLAIEFFSHFKSPGMSLINLYGSTEVMADVTCQEFKSSKDVIKYCSDGHLSIGSLINNTNAIIKDMDENGVGELIIFGSAVTSGYHVNSKIDQSLHLNGKFFDHPQHGHCFKTGDRVKLYQPDVNVGEKVLICMGRRDTQVKINGQRIDLSEITKIMKSDYDVTPVVLFDDERKKILAFLSHDDFYRMRNLESMADFVSRYAIPEIVNIGLKPFPTLPSSGKIDRQKLMTEYRIQQEIKSNVRVDWFMNFKDKDLNVEVKNKLLQLIQVMNESGITYQPTSMADLKNMSFFRVGGSSLNAVLVVSKLKLRGFHVPIIDFLQSNNFLHLLNCISKNDSLQLDRVLISDSSFDSRFEYVSITIEDRDSISDFISRNFQKAEKLFLRLHQNEPILREILDHDFIKFTKAIFHGSVKSGVSYIVREKSSHKMVAACLAIEERDVPPHEYYDYQHDNWAVKAIVTLLNQLEKPITNQLKLNFNRVLMSMFSCIDLDYIQSYADRVLIMFEMEKKIIQSGTENGFDVVITTNTSPVTQDTCDILGYEVKAMVKLNHFVDQKTGLNPFGVSKSDDVVKTVIKVLV